MPKGVYPRSEEQKNQLRDQSAKAASASAEYWRDRPRSEEQKAKQSEAMRGRKPWNKAKGMPPEEKRERILQYQRDYYIAHRRSREDHTRMHLYTRYRMTPEQKERMIADQDGLCYLCEEPLDLNNPRTIHLDHDHTCCPANRGQTRVSCGACIRGIACDPCNRGIGYFGDDPDRMRCVADNLEAATRCIREMRDAA